MKRCLAVATLALGLIAFGCDDDGDGTGTGGRGGTGGTGGTGARGGTGGTGGSTTGGTGGTTTGGTGGSTTGGTGGTTTGGTGGTTTGGTGGGADAADMATTEGGAETAAEAGGETAANICSAYVAGSGMLAGIEAQAFCMEYASACTFGGAMRYASMGECITQYMNASTSVKTCRAGHLCNASQGNAAAKTTHCPHATGMGLPACM